MSEERVECKMASVGISAETNAKLGQLCKRLKLTKKEFVEYSLLYFSKPGRDPREANEQELSAQVGAIEQRLKKFESAWNASKNSWEKLYFKPLLSGEQDLMSEFAKLYNSMGEVADKKALGELTVLLVLMITLSIRTAPRRDQAGNLIPENDNRGLHLLRAFSDIIQTELPEKIDVNRLNELVNMYSKRLIYIR